MDLKGIISITGMSGLYKVVAQAKNGFIVESLADKKRFPISSSQRISALEDISVYAQDEDVPLSKIFLSMKESSGVFPDAKADNKALAAYFKSVLPHYDAERVYTSDIKKIINWFSILKNANLLEAAPAVAETAEGEAEEKPVVKVKKEKAAAPKPSQKIKAESSKKGEAARMRKKV